jgi:hypothetical protein
VTDPSPCGAAPSSNLSSSTRQGKDEDAGAVRRRRQARHIHRKRRHLPVGPGLLEFHIKKIAKRKIIIKMGVRSIFPRPP